MGEGVDACRTVEKKSGTDEESPNKELHPVGLKRGRPFLKRYSQTVGAESKRHGNDDVETVEPDEFGKFGEIFDSGVIRGEVFAGGNPAYVCPKEPMDVRRVGVIRLVGMEVVVAVVVRPPKAPPLDRGAGPNRHNELEKTRGAVGLV